MSEGSNRAQVSLDFSHLKQYIPDDANAATFIDGCGFSIQCGACNQFISFTFDGNTDRSKYNYNYSPTNSMARGFTIGIKSVRSVDDLAGAIFKGIKSLEKEIMAKGSISYYTNTENSLLLDANHEQRIEVDPTDSSKFILSRASTSTFSHFMFDGRGVIDKNGDLRKNPPPDAGHWQWVSVVVGTIKDNPLKIHHGPKANQATNFYIEDMHTKSLGTGKLLDGNLPTDAEDLARYDDLSHDEKKQHEWIETLQLAENRNLDQISVTTRQNANVAIRVIDGAIEDALDEATYIGSYLQRLDYTGANVTTMGENVQAAESAIRDADMAKEMTDYTKMNVLAQASQAMLAQANQNSSQVLSLLQ